MKKLTLPLALIAVATLAACAGAHQTQVVGTADPTFVASTGMVTAASVRPGKGKVAYLVDPTGPINAVSTQYVILHMRDGTNQAVTVRGAQLAMGEHITIPAQGDIGRDRYYFMATE